MFALASTVRELSLSSTLGRRQRQSRGACRGEPATSALNQSDGRFVSATNTVLLCLEDSVSKLQRGACFQESLVFSLLALLREKAISAITRYPWAWLPPITAYYTSRNITCVSSWEQPDPDARLHAKGIFRLPPLPPPSYHNSPLSFAFERPVSSSWLFE